MMAIIHLHMIIGVVGAVVLVGMDIEVVMTIAELTGRDTLTIGEYEKEPLHL